MRRYIVLLLITGIMWAQTDFDKLVLKDGTTYLGEYSKIEGEKVFFKTKDAFTFQPISIKQIQTLKLKDGHFIILNGKDILALEEYQKLSTEEKGIYDANLYNLNKWALYGPMSTILFGGCVLLNMVLNDLSTPSPIFLGGSLAASLTIPYFVLNRKENINFPKSILTDSEKEIYKQAYSKKLRQRKFKYAAVGTIVSFVTFAVVVDPPTLSPSTRSGGTTGKGFTGFGP
jgi:hypothetical protein